MSCEWRVFLPLHVEDFVNEEIQAMCSTMSEFFSDIRDEEVRDDEYAICRSHFGLKKRHLKKAELKIRKPCLVSEDYLSGVDIWYKSKLGKKSLNSYRDEVVRYGELIFTC